MIRSLTLLLALLLASGCVAPAPESASTPAFGDTPIIDIHTHIRMQIPDLPDLLRNNNIRAINICGGATNPESLKENQALYLGMFQEHGVLFPFASTFDVTRRYDPDYADQVAVWLDASYELGAVMTKIWKGVGLDIKTPDGEFIMPDDPMFDPVYAHIAARGKPLIAHLAEPREAWLPLDPNSLFYSYYSKHPQWHMYGKDEWPGWERIIAARDHVLEKHPDLTVIGAHLGSMSHDVDVIAERLDRYPNFYVEPGARTIAFTRQPAEKVRGFFQKYQDRVLYGTDLITATGAAYDEYPAFQRAKTAEEALKIYRLDYQYYAGTGTVDFYGAEVECLGLPRNILDNFYYGNAQRIIPGLIE